MCHIGTGYCLWDILFPLTLAFCLLSLAQIWVWEGCMEALLILILKQINFVLTPAGSEGPSEG